MQFPGYWVYMSSGKAVLERTTFDETELDPATNWKTALQNEAGSKVCNGFVELRSALIFAAQLLATIEDRPLGEREIDKVVLFEPEWMNDSCQIQSISQLLGAK